MEEMQAHSSNAEVERIREATSTDILQIHQIHAYYIEKTVMNFAYVPSSVEDLRTGFYHIVSTGFPYFVAVHEESVSGYAYAQPFRQRAGYIHTAELTIFLHPEATGRGIGSRLLQVVIDALIEGEKIKQLIAVIAIDPEEDEAERLRRFYTKAGFVEVGHLRAVGRKFDQWLDTKYMQLAIG
ncbi:MAG: hypothetical protein LQ342_003580 [Letrouitia transgressa]|nr:MAG: hypothetical protein LQ342_003580 [Letrouitia transgressa]